MHVRKFLSIFLIGLVFAIAGCSGSSSSGGSSDNEQLPDSDGDGIVDPHDNDMDGDGIDNEDDTDDDGDGIPDATDPTPNGDGGEAPTPGLVCTEAKIIAPNRDRPTGKYADVSWDLLPAGCGVQGGATGMATATAEEVIKVSLPVSPGAGHVLVQIPHKCSWTELHQKVTYSISQIGTALGDPSADTDPDHNYKQTIEHPVSSCLKDPAIAYSNIVRIEESECSQPDPASREVVCETPYKGKFSFWAYKKMSGIPRPLKTYKKPSWDSTPRGIMSVWLDSRASDSCVAALLAEDWSTDPTAGDVYCPDKTSDFCDHPYKKARINYKGSASHLVWDRLAAADCKVATSFEGCPAASGFINCPTLSSSGNFIVETSGAKAFEIRSYSPGN